jgi:ABC-type glycerol-3-phosphate transport system permease component
MDPASDQASYAQPTQPVAGSPLPPPPTNGATGGRNPAVVIVGLLLALPALVALIVNYLLPTIWTISSSFQDVNPLREGSGRPVGTKNYEAISENLGSVLGYGAAFALLPLLTFLIGAPLMAFAAHYSGLAGRWVLRIVLALPMACVAPAALAAAYRMDQIGQESPLTSIDSAPFALLAAAWVGSFGVLFGVGITVYLAALRRKDTQGSVWPGLLAVAGLGVLAIPAIALQTFTYPYIATAGGPANSTVTPMLEIFDLGFRRFAIGPAAAASTIVLAVLALLGLLAALLVILTGLRIEHDPLRRSADDPTGWPSSRVIATVLGGLGLLISLPFLWNGIWPALSRAISRTGGEEVAIGSSTSLFVNTWLPPLVSVIVSVGLAVLAGFGIGALRPLGRHSELLLLPFAPWLFVGLAPLAIAKWDAVREADQLNTFIGMIPPVGIAIPALFVFTLLFKGQARRREEMLASGMSSGDAGVRAYLPALPMLVLVGGFSWLVQSLDIFWPLLVASDPDHFTGPMVMLQAMTQFSTQDGPPIFLALPVAAVLVSALVLAAGQVLYLDRIAIRAGRR